jgi:cytochrome c oxidase subunit 2
MIRARKLAVTLLCAAFVLTACTGRQSALDAHGAPAERLFLLIVVIVAVCAAVWLAVVGVLAVALWRKREASEGRDELVPRTERRMMVAVVGGIAATVVIITGLTMASFFATRSLVLASDNDLTIQVRGLQWWWDAKYVDPSSARSFRTANELHIPVGRNVRIQLDGVDVIHSFWVPSLAGKQDLIPGRLNEITIRAERPGVYRGQCSEFCGLQHAHMAFFVVAEEESAFESWANVQTQPETPPSDAEVQQGREVFLSKPCAACHAVRGTSAVGTSGPDLTHVGSRQYIASGLLETTRGSLAAWIADPQTIKPGNNMPLVPLTAEELKAVSAYMASLK